MKKFLITLLIAVVAITGTFAATAVDNSDLTFGGKAGWVRISGEEAVTFNATITYDHVTNDDFTAGVIIDAGLATFTTKGARFTQYLGPVFTFKNVIPRSDVKASAGVQFVEYTNFFDVGVGADLKVVTWVTPGCGVTVGGNLARLLKSHTNMYGAYIGVTCQL